MCIEGEREALFVEKKWSWVAYESKPVLYIVNFFFFLMYSLYKKLCIGIGHYGFGASWVENISSHVFCASATFLYVTFWS